jgi:hypothetical protein
MLRFFFKKAALPQDKDTPYTEYRDPYLEQVVEELLLQLDAESVKIKKQQQTEKEIK